MARIKFPDFWCNRGRYKRRLDREFKKDERGNTYWIPLPSYGEKYPKALEAERKQLEAQAVPIETVTAPAFSKEE